MQKTDILKEARPYQRDAIAFSVKRIGSYHNICMGGGKTFTALNTFDVTNHHRAVVLCPKSVVPVWRREIEKWTPGIAYLCLDGNDRTAEKAVDVLRFNTYINTTGRGIVIVSYNAAAYNWTGSPARGQSKSAWLDRMPLAQSLIRFNPNFVILDEAHRIKAPHGQQSKFAAKLCWPAAKRLALSGTPLPHDLLDAFGQYRALDVNIFGYRYATFKAAFADCDPLFPSRVWKWKNQEDFRRRLHSIMYTVTEEDANLNLPPITTEWRNCNMSAEARRIYRELRKELITEWEGKELTVPNTLVKLIRLQQIACGILSLPGDEDGNRDVRIIDDAKAKLLEEMLEDLEGEPVVVFCRFKPDLVVIKSVAERLNRRYGELSGSTRWGLTNEGTMSPDVDVMGVQVQSGGLGIDLTRARYAFIYSTGHMSPGMYDQILKRVHRPGQARATFVYHLCATNTIDMAMYKAMRERKELIDVALTALKEEDSRGES